MTMMNRNYSELVNLKTFEDRYNYLKLSGVVGQDIFGSERYLNQNFYTSRKWRSIRDQIIIRDNACDLGLEGYEIYDKIIVHHINPITIEDLENDSYSLYDPENLICTTNATHQAIHYSDETLLPRLSEPRRPNDMVPWK